MLIKGTNLQVSKLIKPTLSNTTYGNNDVITLDQSREVYRVVDDIVENLDEVSLDLIFSASEHDVELARF